MTATTSTAKLEQLMKRWRASGIDASPIDPKTPPELVLVRGMRIETWKLRLTGKPGTESLYDLIDVREVPPEGASP